MAIKRERNAREERQETCDQREIEGDKRSMVIERERKAREER